LTGEGPAKPVEGAEGGTGTPHRHPEVLAAIAVSLEGRREARAAYSGAISQTTDALVEIVCWPGITGTALAAKSARAKTGCG